MAGRAPSTAANRPIAHKGISPLDCGCRLIGNRIQTAAPPRPLDEQPRLADATPAPDHRKRARLPQRPIKAAQLVVPIYEFHPIGDSRWDAPVTLAGLVERTEQDGAAHLALSYEVLDLVAVRRDDLPRSNLLRWVAELEQSVQAGALPERVRELGEWLAEAGEPGLTRTFDLWLAALGRKWGVELPSIREYEEASAVLAEKIDRWGAEILEQGIERQKALLRRLAERRFGPAAAERLATVVAEVTDADRLAETGE